MNIVPPRERRGKEMIEQPQQQQMNPLQERIEKDVRLLVGDLQMQIVILKALLDQHQQGQVQHPQQVKPNGGDIYAPRQPSAT